MVFKNIGTNLHIWTRIEINVDFNPRQKNQEASPLLTKCATVGVLCATGDAISQAVAQPTLLRGEGRYDFARTARMAVFGCVISVRNQCKSRRMVVV